MRTFPAAAFVIALTAPVAAHQAPGHVAIRYEMIHETRVIPLDRRPPLGTGIPLTADENPVPSDECHEGNYGLRNILSAARAEERERTR